MSFLNQQKGENDCKKYFLINLHESKLPTRPGGTCIQSDLDIYFAHFATLGNMMAIEADPEF